MVENYPEHPGMEKILSLWKKMQNKNIIFLFEKDVIEEVERLYNEIITENTVISIDLDNEINLKENVDWLKENFEYISQLVSDQLHIDVEVARNILSNTIESIKDENEDDGGRVARSSRPFCFVLKVWERCSRSQSRRIYVCRCYP